MISWHLCHTPKTPFGVPSPKLKNPWLTTFTGTWHPSKPVTSDFRLKHFGMRTVCSNVRATVIVQYWIWCPFEFWEYVLSLLSHGLSQSRQVSDLFGTEPAALGAGYTWITNHQETFPRTFFPCRENSICIFLCRGAQWRVGHILLPTWWLLQRHRQEDTAKSCCYICYVKQIWIFA